MSPKREMRLMVNRWLTVVWLSFIAGWGGPVMADNVHAPTKDKTESQAERIAVWYATIRNSVAQRSDGEFYGGLRGELRMGICALDFTPIPGLEHIANSAPFFIPEERKELQRIDEFIRDRLWETIDAFTANPSGKIVLYIHGYNVGFEKSCHRAAIFQRSLNPRIRLLLFSWPADGNVLSYTRDEADLVWSVPQIASILQELTLRVGPERLEVVAHSLGARGVVMALSRIACKHARNPLVNELILVAPDIDKDYFFDAWPEIKPLIRRTTLYVSENDRALRVSHAAHGYPRLGEAGQHLTVLAGIETVDVSPAGKRRFSGHIYHLYHPAVVEDLQVLLNTGRPADQRSNLQRVRHRDGSYWRLDPKNPQPTVE